MKKSYARPDLQTRIISAILIAVLGWVGILLVELWGWQQGIAALGMLLLKVVSISMGGVVAMLCGALVVCCFKAKQHILDDSAFEQRLRDAYKDDPMYCSCIGNLCPVLRLSAAISCTDEDIDIILNSGHTPGRVIPPSWGW